MEHRHGRVERPARVAAEGRSPRSPAADYGLSDLSQPAEVAVVPSAASEFMLLPACHRIQQTPVAHSTSAASECLARPNTPCR